ncbi:unnamed protein product [Phytophthora lilii]|uniref:Unnamed protein product n=1 Tax=Phytophthora lilii TaxID=2077276 RepID=A0A9W6WXJ5_9STRA|nr:unnamed protein product [Phytophthora lilii]
MASSWSARACSGDAAAALLQPHQLLLSVEDAALRGVRQLDLVRVCFASRGSVLLQCVVGGGQAGRVQLHAWVLDVCGQLEDAAATLQKVEPSGDAASWRLRFSVLTKFPPVATAGADGTAQLGESRADLLPLSVRQRHVDLEKAVARQLRAMGTLRAPQTGQLVPVKLLGDTFVFRVDAAERTEAQHSQVVVTGWSDEDSVRLADTATPKLTEQVAALSIQDTTGSSYESELDARLWQTGFVGYTAFLQDVLLNLALVLKRGQKNLDNDVEMEQIGSHGLLVSGVNGVGKSLALAALQRELAREKIRTWRVDGMSLLMGAESPAFPTAFEYLTYELEKHFPEFGSLNDLESEGSFVGVVLIDDLDVLFQSADGQTADGSDTQLPQLGSALLRLIDELSSRNARLVIVGATSSADANVPLVAKRTGRFGKVLDLVVPTEQTRRDILERHLNGLPRQSDEGTPIKTNARNLSSRLAAITGGYVAKDLVRICRNAAAQVHAESSDNHGCTKLSVGWNELLRAQQQIKPSQLRELNVASPGATIDGKLAFAGYAAVQKQLFDFISWKFHPTAAMNVRALTSVT